MKARGVTEGLTLAGVPAAAGGCGTRPAILEQRARTSGGDREAASWRSVAIWELVSTCAHMTAVSTVLHGRLHFRYRQWKLL